MKFPLLAAGLIAVVTSGTGLAGDPAAAAQKAGCMACHSMDKKLVGPAWKDVAARYKSDKGAVDKLAAKVRSGGKGNWGEIVQPPNTTTSDADIKKLVQFILTL